MEITEPDYQRLFPRLVRSFRAKGLDEDQACELAQDTFLRAHRGRDEFRHEATLDTWITSIAKNVWLQYLRRKRALKRDRPEVLLEAGEPVEFEASQAAAPTRPDERLLDQERIRRAGQALSQLPDRMRRALLLRTRGHKYDEIATLQGATTDQVSSWIHQARDKLRRDLLPSAAPVRHNRDHVRDHSS